jgi:hypothetical protein
MPIDRDPLPPIAPAPKPGGLGGAIVNGILYAAVGIAAALGARIRNGLFELLERLERWLTQTYQDAIATVVRKVEGIRNSDSPAAAIGAMFDPLPLIAIIPVIAGFVGGVASGAAQRFISVAISKPLGLWQYETNRVALLGRLDAPEGQRAERRGAITLGEIIEDLRDQGWSDERITALLSAANAWLTPGQIEDMYYRQLVDRGRAAELLRGLGLQDEQVDLTLQTFERIPAATDLVRFVVREVYDPGLRAQQLEGIDAYPQFLAQMAKQGFNPFDAASYWAAHWDLPSATQGYEMAHRLRPGQTDTPFTIDDLRALLRRNDVLPAYIEQLIAIAYRPVTRIDLRRLYTSGVYTRDQVFEGYLDLGYDPERAEALTAFATRDAASQDRDLTKTEVLNAYKRRLLSRDEAAAALQDLGYDQELADLLLASADYDLAQTRAARRTTVIRARFLAGLLSPAAAVNQLADLAKPPEEIDELITLWGEQLADRIERPTPSQLIGFYRDRVISGPDVAAELRLAGYDDRYVGWYIAQADADIAEQEARRTEAENRRSLVTLPIPTRGDLANWLRRAIITPEQFTERLLAQGYTAQDVAAYAASVRLPIAIPFYGSPEGRVRTLEAKLEFSRAIIDAAELRRRLGAVGYPAELADAIADYEELKAAGAA